MTRANKKLRTEMSNNYYPPPPGVDGRRSNNATRDNSYRPPPPPSFDAPPPPPAYSSSNSRHDTYAPSSRYNDRERDYDRGYDRGRDDRFSRNDRDDHYQPSYNNDNSYRPLPSRPQDSSYSSSYRDSRDSRGGDSFRPPQGDFSFRADKPAGVGDSYSSYRPSDSGLPRNAPRGPARGPYQGRDRPSGPRNFRGGRAGNENRRPWKPFRPAERAIVQGVGNQAPAEDYADEENGVTYRAIDQLSDSDEADMDISDSDNESGEPTAKRARTTKQAANGDSAPRWCNPDPYDALPPVEDTDRKRKDMVQLIRKARVQATAPRSSLPGEDEDFIRLDVDSDVEVDTKEDEDVFIDPLTYNRGESKSDATTAANGVNGGAQNGSSAQPSRPQHALPPKPVSARPSGAGQVAPQAAQASAGGSDTKIPFIDLSRGDIFPANKHATFAVDVNKKSELGTRKRTHDDVLKLPSHAVQPKPTGNKRPPAGGHVIAEWRAKKNENSCPWVKALTFKAHLSVR